MNEKKTFWACSIWHGWDNNWVGNMNGMKRKIIQFHENHAQNADCLNLVSNSWNFENSKKSNNTLDWWILEHWLGVDGEREKLSKWYFPSVHAWQVICAHPQINTHIANALDVWCGDWEKWVEMADNCQFDVTTCANWHRRKRFNNGTKVWQATVETLKSEVV